MDRNATPDPTGASVTLPLATIEEDIDELDSLDDADDVDLLACDLIKHSDDNGEDRFADVVRAQAKIAFLARGSGSKETRLSDIRQVEILLERFMTAKKISISRER